MSQDNSGRGRSVSEQVADGYQWAVQQGWSVVSVIEETGSASRFSSRRERAAWAGVLRLISERRVDIILTWESSRATRDLAGYVELREACARAGVLWGYGRKVYDFGNRDDRFRTGIDALLAEDEVARMSERLKRAAEANARAGRPHGRNLYGYQRVYDSETKALIRVTLDPITSLIVKSVFEATLRGDSLYAIAKRLNERGVPPRNRKRVARREAEGWTGPALKQMLSTPAYAGLRQFQGVVIGPADWPAIVGVDDWEYVQLLLRQSAVPRERRAQLRFLLTGIATCVRCGLPLRSGRNTLRTRNGLETYRNYLCPHQHTSIAMKHLDAIVEQKLLSRLASPDVAAGFLQDSSGLMDDRRVLLNQLHELRNWLKNVREIATELQSPSVLFAQEALIQPRIESTLHRLKMLTDMPVLLNLVTSEDVSEVWNRLDLAAKRSAVRALMAIRIHPAAQRGAHGLRQASERSEITWR